MVHVEFAAVAHVALGASGFTFDRHLDKPPHALELENNNSVSYTLFHPR